MNTQVRLAFISVAILFSWNIAVETYGQKGVGEATESKDEAGVSSDWDSVRRAVEDYAQAYNSGDAEAISQLYTQNAELVDADGSIYQGREEISEVYRAFFEKNPNAEIRMVVEKLNFVSPTVAIENGRTESRLGKDQPESPSRYVAVHLKEDGQWRMASVRDEALPVPARDNLEQLSWMIGKWVDEDDDSLIEIDCYWHDSGSYLIRDFRIKVKGLLASTARERIGWDHQRQQIRSWLFDADGGYLDGSWVHSDDHWVVAAHGFRADGEPTHATYVITPLREDAYHVDATQRSTGRRQLDAFDMTIVRRPPSPGDVPDVENRDVANPKSQEEQDR